jgi:hypothetical protein
MNIKTNDDHSRATFLKVSHGQYELIGGTPEELLAAKQWAAFWGHQIVTRTKCRRMRIPPLFRFHRVIQFMKLRSRGKF